MSSSGLRVLFVVQGEGRGHMTQAIAMAEMLRAHGHRVEAALVGASRRRRVPRFFQHALEVPVETYDSPSFVAGTDGRIHLGATVWNGIRRARRFAPGFETIARTLDRTEPDVVINFYEGLFGLYALLRAPVVPVVAVGHQFMFEHPCYDLAPGRPIQRAAARLYTTLAGGGASVKLALSFYPAPDVPERRLAVTPPLLRRRFRCLPATDDGSVLVYLLEPAMADDLIAWSERNPGVRLHCFTGRPPSYGGTSLTFHPLCGTAFPKYMARAMGVVCTAGFESISEAMYLGKPALMVPVPGHAEQHANARDAERSGAGVMAESLDLDALLDIIPKYAPPPDFRAWVDGAAVQAVEAIEAAAGWPVGLPGTAGDGLARNTEVTMPKIEAPKVEAPKVEAPKVEAPKVEAPKVEAQTRERRRRVDG